MDNKYLKMIEYVYNREKARENKGKKKAVTDLVPISEVKEVFSYYRLYIKSDARITISSKQAIRDFLKLYKKAVLIAVMEKKSKSKWFEEHCAWRGAGWFFSNRRRFDRWIEEGIPVQKKRPYFNNQPMTHDCKKVLVDGEWKQFAGEISNIEWRNI